MSFQLIAYALKQNVADTLAKLVFIRIVGLCEDDGYVEIDLPTLASWSTSTPEAVYDALVFLADRSLIVWFDDDSQIRNGSVTCIVTMPKFHDGTVRREKVPAGLSEQMIEEALWTCSACRYGGIGDEVVELHIDHIFPVSKGGLTHPLNLQVLCRRCNSKKKDKTGWVNFSHGVA